jgi:hypothetical protein
MCLSMQCTNGVSIKNSFSPSLVAHTCNPSYSGGRDQKDSGSKAAWANSSLDPISEVTNAKKGW